MKDFLDFIAEGERPRWKLKEYKDYIDTLRESEAIKYEKALIEFIRVKGVNSYDKKFLTDLGYWVRDTKWRKNIKDKEIIAFDLELSKQGGDIIYRDGGNYGWNKERIEKKLNRLNEKYLIGEMNYHVFKHYYNYKYWDRMTVNKLKLQDGVDPLELFIEFREALENEINWSNERAAKCIFNTIEIEWKAEKYSESTIYEYIKRKKRYW